jgi:adenine-specific DNA-methyltransferase
MSIEKLRPSFTFTEDRLKELQSIVPESFADGKINWDTLREALGEHLEDETQEHFGLFWPGKREARRLAALPSKGTLVPQPGQGVNEDTTHNIFIEGDNLEVLKLLQKSYAGRVKLIYIDPPYNTGNDFVYPDDYSEPLDAYLKRTGQVDETGQLLTTNSRANGRFHSNWLNMLYPRLRLARDLLTEDGVLVASIDDTEVHNLRTILDEIFGGENFVTLLVWKSRQFPDARAVTNVSIDHEYILVYSRSDIFGFRGIGRDESKFSNPDNDPRGDWMSRSILGLATKEQRPNLHYSFADPKTGNKYSPPSNTGWRYSRDRMESLIVDNKILFPPKTSGRPREKKFRSEMTREFISFPSIIDDVYTSHGTSEIREIFGSDVFDFPKPSELICRIVEQCSQDEDVILDFFAGSCTTAHALYQKNLEDGINRHFIMVQLPEPTKPGSQAQRAGFTTISEIGRERIRRVTKKMRPKSKGQLNLPTTSDFGFRCYLLDRSNFVEWEPFADKDVSQLELRFQKAEIPLFSGWKPENLLVEILLLQGFPLDSRVRPLPEFKKNDVKEVSSEFCQHRLFVCLDAKIQPETVAAIKLRPEDILVCLDSALSDEAKITLSDRCNLKVI